MPVSYRTNRVAVAVEVLTVLAILAVAASGQTKAPAQMRPNDFPSVRGYDPGYPIPYDPKDPYVALEYVNAQFDGVWSDIDGGNFDVTKLLSRAPQSEDYTDANRANPTPNTPHLTPEAGKVFRKLLPMIVAGNNPAQAAGWCYITHAPTLSILNQFMFTPDSMNASIPGGGGSISVHVYMDGRPHPANLKHSELGHQIAHWEGATLVIDGIGFIGDRDVEVGLLSSDQQEVITRYKRIQPDLLEAEYTLIDPKVLAEPWTTKRRARRNTMEINILRTTHCTTNSNQFDELTGGNNFVSPEGKKLQKVPLE
jgi:hypothetical protein